jgi:hypothetical protein
MRRTVSLLGRPFVAAVFVAVLVGIRAQPATGQAPDVPELKVLDRLAGDWVVEWSLEKTKSQPEGGHFTGTMIAKWSLRNRWLASNFVTDVMEALVLQTYDLQKRAYACWAHAADGGTIAFIGTWDSASNTLTYKPAHADELNASATMKFVDADHSEWGFTIKDPSGAIAVQQHVKLTRWKYPLRKLTREELETDMALRLALRQVKLTDQGGGRFTGTGRDAQDRLWELEVTQEEHRRSWKNTRRSATGTEGGSAAVSW